MYLGSSQSLELINCPRVFLVSRKAKPLSASHQERTLSVHPVQMIRRSQGGLLVHLSHRQREPDGACLEAERKWVPAWGLSEFRLTPGFLILSVLEFCSGQR